MVHKKTVLTSDYYVSENPVTNGFAPVEPPPEMSPTVEAELNRPLEGTPEVWPPRGSSRRCRCAPAFSSFKKAPCGASSPACRGGAVPVVLPQGALGFSDRFRALLVGLGCSHVSVSGHNCLFVTRPQLLGTHLELVRKQRKAGSVFFN